MCSLVCDRACQNRRPPRPPMPPWRTLRDIAFLLLAVVTQLIAVLSVVMFGGFDLDCSAYRSAPARRSAC